MSEKLNTMTITLCLGYAPPYLNRGFLFGKDTNEVIGNIHDNPELLGGA